MGRRKGSTSHACSSFVLLPAGVTSGKPFPLALRLNEGHVRWAAVLAPVLHRARRRDEVCHQPLGCQDISRILLLPHQEVVVELRLERTIPLVIRQQEEHPCKVLS